MFVARMREPEDLCLCAEEKHTLNLSFNINPWLMHSRGTHGYLAPLPSCAPAGEPAAPGRSASPCFATESARAGTLISLPEGVALCEPQVPSAHATPAEGLQIIGLVIAAFG